MTKQFKDNHPTKRSAQNHQWSR